jgi:hypothetical protein
LKTVVPQRHQGFESLLLLIFVKNPGRVLEISRDECRRAKPACTHATRKNPGRVLDISRDEFRWAKPRLHLRAKPRT